MENTTTRTDMVPASNIVHTGLATVSKIIGAGAIATAQGKKVATVKAEHYARQGAALALAASVTGKGRAATVAAYAGAELSAIVNAHGVIDNARAIASVCMLLQEPYTYAEAIRADGARVVKRAEWLALADHIRAVCADPETKKARLARFASALKLHHAIQAHADALRAAAPKREAITG
jgi:hypothetical protein